MPDYNSPYGPYASGYQMPWQDTYQPYGPTGGTYTNWNTSGYGENVASPSSQPSTTNWGAYGAALSAIGNYYTANAQASASANAAKMDAKSQVYATQTKAKQALEDELYQQKAIAAYRDKGTQGLATPTFTDPNVIKVDNPYPKG